MKRILFAAIIGLIFTSCQKQVDVQSTSNSSNNNSTINTSAGVATGVTYSTLNKGMLAYFKFSGNATDLSGNANDGTVSGAQLVKDRFGNASSAYSFTNAANSSIAINTLHTNLLAYSVSGWFQKATNSVNNSGTIFAGDKPTSGPGELNFAIATSNNAEWNAKNQTNLSVGITTESSTSNSLNYSDGVWHSFVVTFNSAASTTLAPSNFQMYIDGVLVPAQGLYKSILTQDGAPVNSNSVLPIILGNSQGQNNAFPGAIDDIRIFNRVISQSEVTFLANEK